MTQPLWTPSETRTKQSQLWAFKEIAERKSGQKFTTYQDLWQWSCNDLETFWNLVWDHCQIIGEKTEPTLVQENGLFGAKFFPESQVNYAENLLWKTGKEPAIIWRGEAKEERVLSWNDVHAQVSKCAQWLEAHGVQAGDRVAAYLPNMPEATVAMLATASLGAVWAGASPDFGVQGLLDRFGQIGAKIFITSDGYWFKNKQVEILSKAKEALAKLESVEQVLLVPYAGSDTLVSDIPNLTTWQDMQEKFSAEPLTFTRRPFNDPLFIMFSSGTTGAPKCIVHSIGGVLLNHVKELKFQCDIKEGDRFFYYTTIGWMMWQWQMSGLATGATLMLYDGSPFIPTATALFDYADAYGMTLFGTSAKYIDALRKYRYKPAGTHKLSSLRTLTSTGSPLVHESFDYIYQNIKQDLHVASVSGGTDILGCFVIGNLMSPVYRGEIQGAGLGFAMNSYDENGTSLPTGEKGEFVCEKPFPSMPIYFWNDENNQKYKKAYFERYDNIWHHGDWVEKTEHGGFVIHGRSDATLNPGGVRIGTAEIYRQVEKIEDVQESLAVGQDVKDDMRVLLFVVMKEGVQLSADIKAQIKSQIKDGASPRHVPAQIHQVSDLPRTKSGKLVELAVREIIHGRPVKNKTALANPEILEEFSSFTA
jgi:acetoacetyl-CoA synthetase